MSIFNHIKLHHHTRYAISPSITTTLHSDSPPFSFVAPSEGSECRMELRIGVDFRTTPDQYDNAVRHAKRKLLEHLYADALCIVRELRSELYAGDISQSLDLLSTLEDVMTTIPEE